MNFNMLSKIWASVLIIGLTACGGGGGGDSSPAPNPNPNPQPTTFSIGGSTTGLEGSGLVLQNNGTDNLAISNNGAFTFATRMNSGASYSVTVSTAPGSPSQNCSVTNGSGTANGNVTNVTVTCTTPAPDQFTIGGTVSGLEGSGFVLQNNGGDDLSVAANGTFTFATSVDSGSAYAVTIATAPSSPAQTCSVANGSGTANNNVSNVEVTCATPVSNVDTDEDGLTDAQEIAIGTSPQLVDTDGDGLSDGLEVNQGGFNPLIADLPSVSIEVTGAPSIEINVIDTVDAGYSNSYGATFEQGQESSYSKSDTSTTSATVEASARVYSEAEATAGPTGFGGSAKSGVEASVSASVTQENSTSVTSTSASSSRQEHSSLAAETGNATRTTDGGSLSALLTIKNTSDLSFDLEGVEIIASRRSGRSGTIQPIGTLVFEIDNAPKTLANDESIQKNVTQEFSNANSLEALMADPSGLLFTIGSFDMNRIGNEEGRDWARISQDVNAKTAQIVIDYGDQEQDDGSTVERYQVATNVARDPVTNEVVGISMQQVMSNSLEIPFTTNTQEVLDENNNPTGEVREVLNSLRDVASTGVETGFWYVFSSSNSLDNPATDFEDIILMPGDRISMVYMKDSDGDRIFDREEYLLGTSPAQEDTDNDGLTDFEEAREGWSVVVEGTATQVFSDPLNSDSDGDTLTDVAEREMGTDPDRADTDNDGMADNVDINPTGPDRVTFVAEFGGPTKLVDTFVSAVASGGRDVTRVEIDWGDGTANFENECGNTCTETFEVNTFHQYQADGMYTVIVTADVEDAPSETRSYTLNFESRFSDDIGMSFNTGWNESKDTRIIADINGDNRDDIVGFGPDGTYTSLSNGTGYDVAVKQFDNFASGAAFNKETQRRLLANVTGNSALDIVVFGTDGVYIAANDGSGQFTVLCNGDPCTTDYAVDQGYSNFTLYPRLLSDMNSDGLDDIVAFSGPGVIIAVSTGSSFVNPNPGNFAIEAYTLGKGNWNADNPRLLADMNGDGLDDIVGFGDARHSIATNRGNLNFEATYNGNSTYTTAGGWRTDRHIRTTADINNDGRQDIVGYANSVTITSLGVDNVNAAVNNHFTISEQFAYNNGWRLGNDPRYLADVNGDNLLDIVGFGPLTAGGIGATYYALNTGGQSEFLGVQEWLPDFSVGREWEANVNPRYVGDVNGDGRADIIGFDDASVEVVFALGTE